MNVRGMLAPLGIIMGQAVNPDSLLRDILSRAGEQAPRQIFFRPNESGDPPQPCIL